MTGYDLNTELMPLLFAAAGSMVVISLLPLLMKKSKAGLLLKLEGHTNNMSPRGRRFTKKWVSCDGAKLSYFAAEGEVDDDDEPRKTLSIGNCVVTPNKKLLQIDVSQTTQKNPYAITFKCADAVEFGSWSTYLQSVDQESWYAYSRHIFGKIVTKQMAKETIKLVGIVSAIIFGIWKFQMVTKEKASA